MKKNFAYRCRRCGVVIEQVRALKRQVACRQCYQTQDCGDFVFEPGALLSSVLQSTNNLGPCIAGIDQGDRQIGRRHFGNCADYDGGQRVMAKSCRKTRIKKPLALRALITGRVVQFLV